MKITTLNNAEIVLQANMNKAGDFERMVGMVELMCKNDWIDLIYIDGECGDAQMTAVWDNNQAKDIKDEYEIAKKVIKSNPYKAGEESFLTREVG